MTILFSYDQPSGEFRDVDLNLIAVGYSGYMLGLNNPDMEEVASTGPIPKGIWEISKPYHSATKGPLTFHLAYRWGRGTFGRSAFLIHGDNQSGDKSASRGCIILPRPAREFIRDRWRHRACVVVI